MVKRLFAFLTRRKLVWLMDMDGEITLAVVYHNPFGDSVGLAYRYWPFKHISGPVFLMEDGTCRHSYVRRWAHV